MIEKNTGKLDPFMTDWHTSIQQKIGMDAWIPLYFNQIIPETTDDFFLFSALAPQDSTEAVLSQYEWEVMVDSFRPGFIIEYNRGTPSTTYSRFSQEHGIEPIIIQRHFFGIKKTYFDVAEEFRHLYNLYYDEHERKYVIILDDGNEEDVIRIADESIFINAKYLKEYLAVKKCNLVLYFNIDRFSQGKFSELDTDIIRKITKTESEIFEISISDDPRTSRDEVIYSRMLGKKIIEGLQDFKPEKFRPGEVNRDVYLEFIIDTNPSGDDVLFTYDEKKLANFFGKNKGKPQYVTPVFFKREVFEKYYADPDRYTIEDGNLSCGGLWSLRLDNNHEKYVVVMLGDLGHLSLSEQRYWRSYNVKPEGGFSDVAFKRGFAAEWTDPSMKDLVFKGKFERFQESWKQKNGWELFLPLSEGDSHYFKKIRVPLKESQSEFDELVLAITKVLIDSLNEKKIQEELSSKISDEKGIAKFERLLSEKGVQNFEEHIKFLRELQNLKSVTASHRKGDEYLKIAKRWGLGKRRFREIYCEILERAIDLLDFFQDVEI